MRSFLFLFFVSQIYAFLWPPYYGFSARGFSTAEDVVGNQVKTIQLTFKDNDLLLFGDLFDVEAHGGDENIVKDLFSVSSASDYMQVKNARFIYHNLNDISADIKIFKNQSHVRTAKIQMKKAPGSPTRWKINKVDLVEHDADKKHHHHHQHHLPTNFF